MTEDGEFMVMVLLIALVFVALVWYWRTPESGGGPQVCSGPPCVEVVR